MREFVGEPLNLDEIQVWKGGKRGGAHLYRVYDVQ